MTLLTHMLRVPALLFAACCDLWHVLISPAFGGRCRFYPSCSQYAAQAVRENGLLRGSFFTAKRVCRCNGFFDGGYDPVPVREPRNMTFNQGVKE